ncbi:uncharacterized protein LOC144089137 [Stigmatopora argus]
MAPLMNEGPPLPPPRRTKSSLQRNSEIRRETPAMIGVTPLSSSQGDPLYIDLDAEPFYLEVLPARNDMAQEASRRQTGMDDQHLHRSWDSIESEQDTQKLVKWLRHISEAAHVSPSLYGLSVEEEKRVFLQKNVIAKVALRVFHSRMMARSQRLQDSIRNLRSMVELLEKDKKKMKSIEIAGGTTGALGGVTALVGVALAPVTMGCSLVMTAVGVGMGVAAGGMGARVSKSNKKLGDRQILEKIVCDYLYDLADIELCLKMIISQSNELQKHDLEKLQLAGMLPCDLTVAQKLRSIMHHVKNVNRSELSSVRLLNEFAKESDEYYKEKGSKKTLRKSTKSRFASRIHFLARNLQEDLDYLHLVWKYLGEY